MIGKWVLRAVIASLVVQLAILAIAVFWTIEVLQTEQQVEDWIHAPASTSSSTPTPTPGFGF